jgi:hypothetical protein
MEISIPILIGIGVVAMFLGYFFGLFEGRGQGYKKRKTEEASNPGLQEAVEVPPPSPPVMASPASAPPPPETSLLKLSLDAHEQPCLHLDGQQVDTAHIEPYQRKRLIDLMLIMRPWVESPAVQRQLAPAPAAPTQTASRLAPARVARLAPASVPAPAPAPSPSGTPAIPVAAAPTPTTMVGQIDAILQTNLIGTPLANRGIRLVESPEGGALVVVENDRYAGVGEVPDPQIQATIRAAIADWEKRYTPG